jgi:sporulation protein YlmC with PRC-barrel domain
MVFLRIGLFALALLMLPFYALAQEQSPWQQPEQQRPSQQQPLEQQPADASPAPQQTLERVERGLPRGTDLLFAVEGFTDSKVVNRQGEEIGTVKQLLIDPKEGRIAYVQIGMEGRGGGIFRRGSEKIISVPWQSLQPMQQDGRLVLAMDENVLPQVQKQQAQAESQNRQ